MTPNSCLYVGSVMHRRLRPRPHRFRYRAFWLLIDLDEIAAQSRRLRMLSHNRRNVFSLCDSDHGDGSATPLAVQARHQLATAGIDIGAGKIQLLCMPRTFGYCFNPLSIYFCRDRDGELAALIYQVHNTFGERHSYVMPLQRRSGALHQSCGKNFYVSPFMDMALRYDFRVSGPDEHIAVGIAASATDGPVLNAVLCGSRRALDDRALLKLCATMPAITLKVIAAIHWEAVRLCLKGLRPRHHPATEEAMNSALSHAKTRSL